LHAATVAKSRLRHARRRRQPLMIYRRPIDA